MKASIVLKMEFSPKEPFSRLDAEFINAPIRVVEHALMTHPGARVGHYVEEHVPALKKCSDPAKTERYIDITSVDTADGLTFEEEIRTEDLPSRAKYRVQAGDIIVSNVRPNRGAIAMLSDRSSGHIASSGFTLLRLRAGASVSREYLFAFLKTRFGREQLVRRNRGSMYPAVITDDVLDVWVPSADTLTESEVKMRVRAGLAHHDEFYRLHGQAMHLLQGFLEPYGAPPSPLMSQKRGINTQVIESGDIFGPNSALRFDAEFFREEYEEFNHRCQQLGASFLLGDHYKLTTGRSLTKGDEATPYMKQGCLTNVGINWSSVSSERGKAAKGAPHIKPGDILLACTAHEIYYVGRKVDLVREIPARMRGKVTCVADLMVIRPRNGNFGDKYGSYVAAFLRHPAGLHQVQRCIRGLRGGHVYRSDLTKYVRVPTPPDTWLENFEELARAAECARNSAKTEMEKAFAIVSAHVKKLL